MYRGVQMTGAVCTQVLSELGCLISGCCMGVLWERVAGCSGCVRASAVSQPECSVVFLCLALDSEMCFGVNQMEGTRKHISQSSADNEYLQLCTLTMWVDLERLLLVLVHVFIHSNYDCRLCGVIGISRGCILLRFCPISSSRVR